MNTGRQSVGHSYLAVLVGLSDSELVSFFKRQGVFAVKHLQSDQYYSKLLSGSLTTSDQACTFDFANDGETVSVAAEKPPSAKRPKLGQEKAQVVAPFAPLAPQFSEQKPKAKAARVSETETQTQLPEKCAEASSSSCKVSSKSQEKSDIVQESTGSKRAAPHNNSGPGFTLAESFKWGAVSFKFRKPASYQVDLSLIHI